MKTKQTKFFAGMSFFTISLTVILASIVHFYVLGIRAFIAGGILLVLMGVLAGIFMKTDSKPVLLIYGFICSLIIIGFGLVSGFWNHAVKDFLAYLHGGLPPIMAKLFMSPEIGSVFFEMAGILTFAASLFAAYYTYQFIRNTLKESNYGK